MLTAGVLLGLLGMHVLTTHGGQMGHAAAGHAVTSVVASDLHDEMVDDVASPGGAGAVVGVACVLALLGGLILLLGPRPGGVPELVPRTPLLSRGRDVPRGRTPSLHVLCISRR